MNATQSDVQNKKWYEWNPERVPILVASQRREGWTVDEVKEYFRKLGYDFAFECNVVIPALFPAGTKVQVVKGDLGDSDKICKTFDVYAYGIVPSQHLVCFESREDVHKFFVKHGWEEVV